MQNDTGKTLRDEFAMAALAYLEQNAPIVVAAKAYGLADALLKARKYERYDIFEKMGEEDGTAHSS